MTSLQIELYAELNSMLSATGISDAISRDDPKGMRGLLVTKKAEGLLQQQAYEVVLALIQKESLSEEQFDRIADLGDVICGHVTLSARVWDKIL